jgi:LPS sulfotransferase NodH
MTMSRKFDYFVIFAEMRTGSNFLESNLDQFPGLKTYGEAFNPYFMVQPKMKELFGVSVRARNKTPIKLIERMMEHSSGLPGFRFFHDHDPRVFEHVIDDPRCAKVILTRNHVDAYVSRKIAWETDQWQLSDVKDVVKAKARFVPEEFEKLYYRMKDFQVLVQGRLQRSGQTAFHIDYDDLHDLGVVNGLARFLGETTQITEFASKFTKQNPEPLRDKVQNYDDLVATVSRIDLFDIGRIPNFEPRRTPMVPSYLTAAKAPVMFMPVQAGPTDELRAWLAALDNVETDDLGSGMTQKDLRRWRRQHPAHRSFTVIRHPAERAHTAFCRHFLTDGPETYHEVRRALAEHYDVPFPDQMPPGDSYDRAAHKTAFLGFLGFVAKNLGGQTPIRVDGTWATQAQVIQGFGQVLPPDHILRESELAAGLGYICDALGIARPDLPARVPDQPFALADIYDDEVEQAVRAAYQRDFVMFGFRNWKAATAR